MPGYFQSFCKAVGDNADLVLCLLDVAEEYSGQAQDKFPAIEECIRRGYVAFNVKNYADVGNLRVTRPEGVLRLFTGVDWTVRRERASYRLAPGEYGIEYWSQTAGRTGHFARTYRGYDSLAHSASVSYGSVHSWYVCAPAVPVAGEARVAV